ncbi:ras-related protein Rab-17 isoform X2 [Pelodiscus sinensis]|uniref:ras-related protein Rab-17 isoform X2 n=1 Tax=Pelodiscus sinensis TaxID=13735 RepID=UPI003F6B2C6D
MDRSLSSLPPPRRKAMLKKNMASRRTPQQEAGSSTEQTYVYKVVLLGTTAVGKSSLAFRYVKNDFRESMPTVGCSFFTQLVCLETTTMKLEIWDTAGQEKYQSVCHLYYRGANAALLVYDITQKEAEEFAKSKSLIFMETSAKSNHRVTEVFMAVACELLKRERQKEPTHQPQPWKKSCVDLQEPSNPAKRCCRS